MFSVVALVVGAPATIFSMVFVVIEAVTEARQAERQPKAQHNPNPQQESC